MNEDGDEEHRIKVRDGGGETDNGTPGKAHGPVGNIVLHEGLLA